MSGLYLTLAKKAIASGVAIAILVVPNSALARIPDDPELYLQSPFFTQIGADVAWDFSTGSKEVVVAIIDTGADTWHEDLIDNVWKNPKEIPDNNRDDDQNGYIDDINGWNFVENNNDVRTSVFDSKDDAEAVRHGTVIAGLIGAVGNNSRNGTGLNWNTSIMSIRSINSKGTGTYSNLVRSVQYAMDNGADVITMSFTGPHNNESLKSVLYQAYQRGIVVVAAAGNHKIADSGDIDSKPAYPGCFDKGALENWVLTVGSVDLNDKLSDFSNYGSCVDLVAPGEGIYSIERYAPQYGYLFDFGGEWSGTSFAAPLVAGAAALIKSYRPTWGADKIIPAIMGSLDSVEDKNPNEQGAMGRGRLNIGRAISSMAPVPIVTVTNDRSGAMYRVGGGKVDRIDLQSGEQSRVTSLSGATFVSLAVTPADDTVGLLLRRETFYFLQFVGNSGAFLGEVSLPIPFIAARQVKRLRFLSDAERVVVEQYDTKRKITIFTVFSITGNKTAQFEVAGTVANWDTGKTTNVVAYVQLIKNTLQLTEVDLDASSKKKFILKATGLVDDMRFGPVSVNGEQAVLLVRQGTKVNQYAISARTQSFRKDFVGDFDAKNPWRLRLVAYPDHLYHTLTYKKSGTFAITDSQGTIVGTVKIPADPAPIVY